MGYHDVFYQKANIIGWTGLIGAFPTVYFLRRMYGGYVEFGHITQVHDDWENNVGREKTRIANDYRYFNMWSFALGKICLHEVWNGGEDYHDSRGQFYPVGQATPAEELRLVQAIKDNQDIKKKYVSPTDAELGL